MFATHEKNLSPIIIPRQHRSRHYGDQSGLDQPIDTRIDRTAYADRTDSDTIIAVVKGSEITVQDVAALRLFSTSYADKRYKIEYDGRVTLKATVHNESIPKGDVYQLLIKSYDTILATDNGLYTNSYNACYMSRPFVVNAEYDRPEKVDISMFLPEQYERAPDLFVIG